MQADALWMTLLPLIQSSNNASVSSIGIGVSSNNAKVRNTV